MENAQGQYTCSIGGKKWDLESEPTCTPSQMVSAKQQDSAGRPVANKERQIVPSASFSLIMVGAKNLAALRAAVEKDTTVVFNSVSTGQSFTLTEARLANDLVQSGHTVQVEMQGVTGVWA